VQRQTGMAVLVAFCWGFSAHIGAAQPAGSTAPKPNAGPTPIPLSEIASQAETTLRSVQNIETTLSTVQVTATIERDLSPLTDEIELRGTEMGKFLRGGVPLELLHSMEIVLQRYRDQLSNWNHDLTERFRILDIQIDQLDALDKVWNTTLQLPRLSDTAPEIPKHVQDIIGLIDRTRNSAVGLRQQDLILQGRILETTARLQAITPAFQQAQTNAAENLFIRDSPPIWNLGLDHWKEATQAALIPPASAALLATYLQREPGVLYLQAALIFFFFLALSWLQRGIKKWTKEEPILQSESPALDLPVSTAITLSFLILGSLYSTAPFLLRAILWGVLLIPITLILRRLVDRALFPMLNALLLLYAVDQFRLLSSLLPFVGRLIFAAEMLGGTLFLVWMIRAGHLPSAGGKTSRLFAQAIRLVVRLSLIVFPLTLLANLLGYMNFANLLGGGAIRSAYVGASSYAGLRILQGLITISLKTPPLSLLRAVQLNRETLQRRVCALVGLLVFIYWVSLTLNFLGLRAPLIVSTEAVLRTNLSIGSLSISLQQVLVFLVTVWAAFALSRFLRFLLEEDIYAHWRLARGIPQAISKVVHYALLLLGFLVGLAVLGVDLTKITILAGAFTVGVGFGLQTVINNFVSGLILLFERPIKVGDVIQIDTDVGEVRRIGIRASIIRTTDGSEVIVPNGNIIANKVTNWTLSDRYRAIEMPVSVARGAAPQRVIDALGRVAANQPGITKEPPPQAYAVSFSSAAVSFNLRVWTDQYENWVQVRSNLALAVDEALSRENIAVA
jgi:potassium-dependent mechanosensitive channel